VARHAHGTAFTELASRPSAFASDKGLDCSSAQSQLAAALRAGARLAVDFRAADLLAAVLRADARLAADPPTFTSRCATWFDAPTSSSVILNAESMIF
jgi:hypothetical protein